MNSASFVGNPEASSTTGFCPVPPPPPPPPVPAGQMPGMRIRGTAETGVPKRPVSSGNESYEPPAAIQNAMMTKDKKPFTYTPGMGGKLDLSQIRSPRMARRVAKNANDEGIEGPPKSPLAGEQGPRPVSTCGSVFIQPQVAVPVFPTNIPPTQQVNRPHRLQQESPRSVVKIETKVPSQPDTPETPTTPPQVNLTRAPTPWLQNKIKQQDELPEWAKRNTTNGSSSNSPPDSPSVVAPAGQQSIRPIQPQHQPDRLIPIRVEDRPSVFSAKNDPGAPGHHQLKQTIPHHQSRWLSPQSPPAQAPGPQFIPNPPRSQAQSSGTYNIPITIEGAPERRTTVTINSPYQSNQSAPSQIRENMVQEKNPALAQSEPGPVQSRSFRVLQKITDTDNEDVDSEQLRKLQLTEDDKILMNKFKEQVDGDAYLHQEEDPRYRGATIPSRAFRYLQNITDSGDPVMNTNAPRTVNSAIKKQNRNSRTFEETQANIPPSEQQVQEPKKYTGSAIPSRSFRILQAMTSPAESAEKSQSSANWMELDVDELHDSNGIDKYSSADQIEERKNFHNTIPEKSSESIHEKRRTIKIDSVNSVDNWMSSDNTDISEGDTQEAHTTSVSSALSISENCRVDNEADNTDSSSSGSDSDSYIAYSMVLDPRKPVDNKDFTKPESYGEGEGTCEKANENDEFATTVCIRLPLRLRVSHRAEEREESSIKYREISQMNLSSQSVESNPCVEFTLRRSNGSARPKSWCPEKSIDEFWTSETILKENNLSPVIFNVQKYNEDVEESQREKFQQNQEEEYKLVPQFEITMDEDEKENEEKVDNECKDDKLLLTVQGLRTDETDDDDSGVTSDMSRIISEVDTDSESTPTQRKISSYKRAQTHSRLFRLLSGESPRSKQTDFSYDNSNNSSGLTSPDFSPISETLWPRHQQSYSNKLMDSMARDVYFKTWENRKSHDSQDFPSSLARRSGITWPYKSNVSCPRIRSTKNVPRALKNPISQKKTL